MRPTAQATGLTSEILEAELRKHDAEELVREDLALEALFRDRAWRSPTPTSMRSLTADRRRDQVHVEETRKKWEEMGLIGGHREGVMQRKAVTWLMENVTVVEVEPAPETPMRCRPSPRVRRRQPRSPPRRPRPWRPRPLTSDEASAAEAAVDAPEANAAETESTEE